MPPDGCISYIKFWDVALLSFGLEQKIADQPFCLIRDIAGTELQYLKNPKSRPSLDRARVAKSIYPIKVTFKANFIIPKEQFEVNKDIDLLLEHDTIQGDCKIRINGVELFKSNFIQKTVYDYFNLVANIKEVIKPGHNEIEIYWPSAGEFDGLKSLMYIV